MAQAVANQALAKTVQLETQLNDVEAKLKLASIDAMIVQKCDLLEALCKQFENNVKVHGLTYDIKVYHKKNATQKREWRADQVRRAFVDTNILKEEDLFVQNERGKKELKRILRDAHPLGKANNATVIFAFTESWLANEIKERVRKGEGLELSRSRTRQSEPEVIRVSSHLPPILECLRNEALKGRRVLMNASGGKRRIICNESFKAPWISLYEIDGDKKTPISFTVEDRRLVNPARSLAIYASNGINTFKPYRLLTAQEKLEITSTVTTDVVEPEKMDI